jgi:hypothetical protein
MVNAPVWIDSRRHWNDSGYELQAHCVYDYEAHGNWVDWWIPASADGYERCWLRPLGHLRRCPQAAWFQLIGCVDRQPRFTFPLGRSGTFTAPASGRLWLYANDAPFAYWNNRGQLRFQLQPATPF